MSGNNLNLLKNILMRKNAKLTKLDMKKIKSHIKLN